jgi:long-chain acyl-CoA synthetase
VALRGKELGRWRQYTWSDYAAEVARIGQGLAALGVKDGDRVALLSGNRPEWLFCDLAIQSIGASTLGIDPATTATEVRSLLATGSPTVVIAGDEEQLDKLDPAGPVIVIDPRGVRATEGILTLTDIGGRPEPDIGGRPEPDIGGGPAPVAARQAVRDGPPRLPVELRAADEVLSLLPLADPAERALSVWGPLAHGYVVNFSDPGGSLTADLGEVQPTVVLGEASMWEAFRAGVETRAANATRLKRAAFGRAMAQGRRLAPKRAAGRLGPADRVASGLAWLVIHRAVREKLGLLRARALLCGGEPVSPATKEWFAALGVPLRPVDPQ